MPLPELLDELFRLYRRAFPVMVGISLLLVLPGLLTSLLSGSYRTNLTAALSAYPTGGWAAVLDRLQTAQAQQNTGWGLLGLLIFLIILPLSIGALYQAAVDAANGRPITVASELTATLERYWPLYGFFLLLLGMLVVWAIALAIGFVLIVIPGLAVFCVGVWLAIRWVLTVPAMMAENIGPIKGFQRSWALVSGMWWRTFGILLLAGIAYYLITVALLGVFTVITAVVPGLSDDLRSGLATAATNLTSALIAPVFPILLTLLYFDLRVRKEGLDLDQLARQTSPGPSPA
jgi:hypothetical protein